MALMRRLVGEDENGATAIEYALVACGISVAIVAAVTSLGSKTNSLYASVPVASLVGHGYLYLYTYHGRNTFSKEHHHHLSTYSRTEAEMHVEADRIREALAHYPIEKPVIVGGRDGPSFVV